MTRFGIKIAHLFGKKLPTFSSLKEAEKALFTFRDTRIKKIQILSNGFIEFIPDYTPESLKAMEREYFRLNRSNSFKTIGTFRKEFEECMAMYFGEVFVRNIPDFNWIVEEFAFGKGKYEIGIKKGLSTIMLRSFNDHFETPNNKQEESIWRKYKQYST